MTNYDSARKRARKLADFYRRVVIYAAVIPILAVVDAFDSSGGWWFYWVALIWGFFLVKRAWCTFGGSNLFNAEWQERKAAELMGRKPKRKTGDDYFDEIATE